MKRVLAALLALVLLLLGATAWFVRPVHTEGVTFVVQPGETASHIADSLHRAGLIRHPMVFRLWARMTGAESDLGRGVYRFEGDVTALSLVEQLRSGLASTPQMRVTIPEGLRLDQTIGLLAMQGVGDSTRYRELLADEAFMASLTPDSLFGAPLEGVTSLEGFLFPETYFIDAEAPAPEKAMLTRLVRQFIVETDSLRATEGSAAVGYGVLVLASIIEKEALAEDEKPLISSVFANRMKMGMALQACPTVLYALEQEGVHRTRLLYEDLDIKSPYNTYMVRGLPPTPICSPSLSSIRAALHPADTNYLYFVADGHGRHRFSKTFEEHKQQRWKVEHGS